MGIYQFSWPHPASDVVVTGTFDEWKGSVKLQKNESGLFSAVVDLGETDQVFYKFIVDGHWTVNEKARKQFDHSGNENNVLTKDEMATPSPATEEKHEQAPTPTEADMSHTPGTNDVPGGFPETPASEVKQSNLDVTPVAPVLPPVVTPAEEREAQGTSVLDIPLPVVDDVKTADVPVIVKESQEAAQVPPEASAVSEVVEAKKEIEREIEQVVPEAPVTAPAEQATEEISAEAAADEDLVETKAELEEEFLSHPSEEEPSQVLAPIALAAPMEKASDPENSTPNGNRSVSPTISPLTTPAAPTTSTFTTAVPGTTFKSDKAPSTASSSSSSSSSSASSANIHDEKKEQEAPQEKTQEKKKEKRRSMLLSRILNMFK
ncbi:hypothetical protein BDZ91DRAFT_760829 [Kalaharituber pfeilii]|nr:hypothetical protein BDZ91DRAFT_760829 [Kalaharituber pfeilii]